MVGRRPLRFVDVTKKSMPLCEHLRWSRSGDVLAVIRGLDVVLIFDEVEAVDCLLVGQGCIAKVVRHHDGGIQRAEVQRRDRHIIIALLGLDDGGTLILLVRT